jgi:hypothetical protein
MERLKTLILGLLILFSARELCAEITFDRNTGKLYLGSEFIDHLKIEAKTATQEDSWLCLDDICIDIGKSVGEANFELDRTTVEAILQNIPKDISDMEVKFIHNHPPKYQDQVKSALTLPPSIGDYTLLAGLQILLQKIIKNIIIEGIVVGRNGTWRFNIKNTDYYTLYDIDRICAGHPFGPMWDGEMRRFEVLYDIPYDEAIDKVPYIIKG